MANPKPDQSHSEDTDLEVRRRTISSLIVGPARDVRDPQIFHSLSLIAFLAWVGLGSDGLSSSCYGPEEAFLALGPDKYLAVFLALLTALTVFIISASYSQTIDEFPTGGGGYLVATKLLGPFAGLTSGCALVIDYVLTISISIASGADAIFSFLPLDWLPWKFWACLAVVIILIAMNLRGVKESVLTLLPIFMAFVVTHVFLITFALVERAPELPQVTRNAIGQVHSAVHSIGLAALAIIFLRAYSLGGGTYTGIEAVSNGLPILREPRTVTGKRTMIYMAISLAFVAGGILFGYMLFDVGPVKGETLNAVLFDDLAAHWHLDGLAIGPAIVTFTLLTEGALLFVAAQTGFVDGPRVLATMATDRWLPRRFSNLSGRLVTQDGVLAMGVAAGLILFGTHASVDLLVVLYAINVFITFTLSQLGMSVHWWRERKREPRWRRKLAINGVGCSFTGLILVLTVTLKFYDGGWVTVAMTGGLIAVCFAVRRHYDRVRQAIAQLEADILPEIFAAAERTPPERDPEAPTAGILVSGFNGLGLATLTTDLGLHSEICAGLGPDVPLELERACLKVAREFPHVVFFAGKLVFTDELDGYISRFLHNHTALEVQNRLQARGLSLVILPIRVSSEHLRGAARAANPATAAAAPH